MATKKPTAKKTRNPSTKKASSSAPKKTLAEQIAAAHERARVARRAGDVDTHQEQLELARDLERQQKAELAR